MVDWTALTNLLFVPANRPERVAKALASEADAVCIDLEDTVPAADKAAARSDLADNILPGLDAAQLGRTIVRINALTVRDGVLDALALADGAAMPAAIMVPKAQSAVEFQMLAGTFHENAPRFVALVESHAGMRALHAIAGSGHVDALMLGVADLSADLGCALAWEPLLHARWQLIEAASSHGKTAIDGPFIHLDDPDGLRRESEAARDLGFHAKAALHPHQLRTLSDVFKPNDDELDFARRALAAFDQCGGQAVRFEGQLLEAPLISRLERILAKGGSSHA